MSELIRTSDPIHAKMVKIISDACDSEKGERAFMAAFAINVDSEDMPDDMESALKHKKKGEDIYILDDGCQKWLIPAKSEKDAYERVLAVASGEKPEKCKLSLYSYKVSGRTPGSTEHSHYDGCVEAESPKMAIIRALAKEYGDRDEKDPIKSLEDWSGDAEQLREDFDSIEDDQYSFSLEGEHTYDVEVADGPPKPRKWTIMTVDEGGRCTWGKGDGKPRSVEAPTIEVLNEEEADLEIPPFKVREGVYLLQCPPAIILAIEEK